MSELNAFVLPAMLVAIFYFLLIAPQRRRIKAHRQLMGSLQYGDEVMLEAGIVGTIAEVEDEFIWLEVAPEVELKIAKSKVSRVISSLESEDAGNVEEDDDVDEETNN